MTLPVSFEENTVVAEGQMINEIEGCNYHKCAGRPDDARNLPKGESCFARLSDVDLCQLTLIFGFLNSVSTAVEICLLPKLTSDVIKLLAFCKLAEAIWISVGVAKRIQLCCPLLQFLLFSLSQDLSMMIIKTILLLLYPSLLSICLLFFKVFFGNAGFEPLQIGHFHIDIVNSLESVLMHHPVFSLSLLFFIIARELWLCTSVL